MKPIAKIIRIKGTDVYVKSAEEVMGVDLKKAENADGQPIVSVTTTENFNEAKTFPGDNNDAEMYVQQAPDSGFLTVPFSSPVQGGTAVYEVVPVYLGDPVENWIE